MNDVIDTTSEEETVAAGERFGRTLTPGTVVLLTGQLGAGKTAFVRGMAAAAGVPASEVSSPTFTLIQEYAGGLYTLYHADLYRLSPPEVADLGLDDLSESGGVLAVEWPDRWLDPPPAFIEVSIADDGETRRRITIRPPDA